jgi:hypothetical protein
MADSANTTNLFRRRALGTVFTCVATAKIARTAAGFVLAFPPGSPEGDVELFARWREYLRLETELNAAEGNRDLINWKARQAYPPKPDCLANRDGEVVPPEVDADAELCATADLQPGWQSAAERMAEAEAWAQKCEAIRVRFGLPELETAFKTAWDRQWAAFARFVATPATTLTGLAFKTSAIFYFADETRRAWRGTLIEKRQLEPDQEILLTLRRDLLRLAGLPDDFAMEYGEVDEQYFGRADWQEP